MPKDPANQLRTQFSFSRFAIPALTGYRGRAAYADADMLVFHDMRELWDIPFDGATVLYDNSPDPARPSQFSVILLDCARLDWKVDEIVAGLDAGQYNYDELMKQMYIVPKEQVRDRCRGMEFSGVL